MKQQNKATCPACFQGHLTHMSKRVNSSYRGHIVTYLQPGEWCDHCEEGILSGDDVLATQGRLLQWRAKVDRNEARALSVIRRRLKLTQREAAEIAGGGKNAFSRYERGQANPVKGVSVLFKLLDRHPELLTEAREFAAP